MVNILLEPLCPVRMKIYLNGLGLMTKMKAMPMYGKKLLKSSEPEL